MRKFVEIRETVKEIKEGDRKKRVVSVYTSYRASGKDLMKKGGKFYAILDHETSMWSTNEQDTVRFIDREIANYISSKYRQDENGDYWKSVGQESMKVVPSYLDDSSTNRLKDFNIWMSNLSINHNFKQLDQSITFTDTEVTPEMYRSKRLLYDVKEGPIDSYEKIMSTLYSDDNRNKIEWAIGSVFTGDSKKIEKLLVLYGDPGSGKSTVLDLVKKLFEGYWSAFVAAELVSSTNQFGTAAFKDNPLVAIQDDGKMSKIETPTVNELVSHKHVTINEKGKQQYTIISNAFLFLATNDPVDIHDTKLGITRRLLDVYPSGNKIKPVEKYRDLVANMEFEKGAIAYHCIQVFKKLGKEYYEGYIPIQMIKKTNYLQNFLSDNLTEFSKRTYFLRNDLYDLYKTYYEESGLGYPPKRITFTDQLKEYFDTYEEMGWVNGRSERHIFRGLKISRVLGISDRDESGAEDFKWLSLECTTSLFDQLYSDQPAQYANEEGNPKNKWEKVKTTLKSINTKKLHWLKLPENVIKMDFDKRDKDGNKSLEENLKAANKFPKTYAEVSKSGCGIHLYYIYDGDPNELSRLYDENIEIKLSTGNNAHRRILTRCNDLPITHISTGLPLKEVKKKVEDIPVTVSGLRTTIRRCLAKEIHGDTRSNIDWIYEVLDRAYNSGLQYDLTDMKEDVEKFAANSTNQSDYCKKKVLSMKFKSEKGEEVFDSTAFEDEEQVRDLIKYYLGCNVFADSDKALEAVKDTLDKAYDAGLIYDVSDLYQDVLIFAINHHTKNGVNLLGDMRFCSEKEGTYCDEYDPDGPLIFFDIEVKPNMNLLCWKYEGDDQPVIAMFNPKPEEIDNFLHLHGKYKSKIIGYNNKEYDNHILHAMRLGKSPYDIYLISKNIVGKDKNISRKAKFREAKKYSYSDIFDFMPEKISLKKWENRLNGVVHSEFAHPWDEPLPEDQWEELATYCKNDVIATEAVFKSKDGQAAWKGRQILVDLANILMGPGSVVNDSTNELTTKLIVGNEPNPQQYFVYPDLSKEFPGYEFDEHGIDPDRYISKDVIITGKSFYRGYDPGEGGFVWAKPGMYGYSESDDSASHHPSTLIAENGFGKFTPNYKRLLDLRLMVKHKEYDKLRTMYNGALAKYLETDEDAGALSFALKIAINAVYGLTAAKFKNRLRDDRNKDNWVAKRGALFMIDLMLGVQELGYTVLHCKTDSIKILNPDDRVRNYIYEYGKKFGYTFEIEHRFDRLCLVNDAVYVCKYTDEDVNGKAKGQWDATGKQFQVPYVFKTLFSHEPIQFEDMCEIKNSSTALYLDTNENLPEGEHDYHFIGKTGQFCPIKPGCGGGYILRDAGNGKFAFTEGTKGFRWLESEFVSEFNKQDDIDRSYYNRLVDKAVETISKFGSFDAFVAEGKYVDMNFMNIPETEDEEIPWK